MKILFMTQGESLRLFEGVRVALGESTRIERAGFILADSMFYSEWLRETPDFEHRGHVLLKEWEVTARREGTPDLAELARYERQLGGEPGLFGAVVADRRLFMGPDCAYSQDYRRRFTDDELLCILQQALMETERLFDELKPDVVIGFICVTIFDYLVYLFARARGVRFLNLRPTRVGDRVTLASLLNDPTPEFVSAYRNALAGQSPSLDKARQYIRRVREQHGLYEGVVKASAEPALKVNRARQPAWKVVWRVARHYRSYRRSAARTDNHVSDPLRALLFGAVINPLRARRTARLLAPQYIRRERLEQVRYVFYPMHTEPEISLLLYGRPYVNQIEIIRQIAISLPVDMELVVKEHPWMVGKRSQASYRKILNIPRVRLASPDIPARDLIERAAMIAVITGSVALEAALLGKPVLTFGDAPFNALPPHLVRRCEDPRRLQVTIRELLATHRPDDDAVTSYVAAVFDTSESVNFYSALLQKKGVYTDRPATYTDELLKLARYVARRINERPATTGFDGAASW